MIWEPFVLALVLGLVVSGGLYFAYMWPDVELVDEAAAAAAAEAAQPKPPKPAKVKKPKPGPPVEDPHVADPPEETEAETEAAVEATKLDEANPAEESTEPPAREESKA